MTYAVFARFKPHANLCKKKKLCVHLRARSVEMGTGHFGGVHFDRAKVLIFLPIFLNDEIVVYKRTVLIRSITF